MPTASTPALKRQLAPRGKPFGSDGHINRAGNPFAGQTLALRAVMFKKVGTPRRVAAVAESIYQQAKKGDLAAADMFFRLLSLYPKDEPQQGLGGPGINIGAVNIALSPALKQEWEAFGELARQVRTLPATDNGNGQAGGNGHG